jgi:glycosyltransferase involved in cell wall biosynthesis
MLETFSKLKEADLVVAGDGDLLGRLKQNYVHCSNICFKGLVKQSELVTLYQHATALILPSLAPETFGLTVAEAFACGTPAIVRNAGGSRELVDATGAGFIYSTDNELETAVKTLATDTALRSDLGKKARAGFTRLYTATHHLSAYISHIEDIQQQKGIMLN